MATADIVDLSLAPREEAPFAEFLQRLRERLEFDHAAYAGINPVGRAIHGFVTYPDAWKAHYVEQGFQALDPTLATASRSIAPVDWKRLRKDDNFQAVFRDARDFGISDQGLTIPVRGPFGDTGFLSVTRDCGEREWELLVRRSVGELQAMAVHMHDAVMQSDALSRALRHPSLSKREREILQWIAMGKSQQDVADILSLATRTVEVHLRSAREKLFALTTAQAVARAVALRLIHPF